MFRHELSPFLQRVLDAVAARRLGLAVEGGEPDDAELCCIALELREDPDDVRAALLGLRASHCLIEHELEVPGIEPLVRWTAHPQCVATD